MRFERFESRRAGLFTSQRESRMIAYAQADAEEWLAEHPEIEVVAIDTTCGQMLACVTIWYRE